MNKLIKSAMMMASVGAMLCVVGCGKELTPAEKADKQIADFFALVTYCGGVVPAEAKEAVLEKSEAEKIKTAEEISKAFPKLKKYGELIKEFNTLSLKVGGNPAVKREEVLGKLADFGKNPQKLDSEIEELEKSLGWLRQAAAEKK